MFSSSKHILSKEKSVRMMEIGFVTFRLSLDRICLKRKNDDDSSAKSSKVSFSLQVFNQGDQARSWYIILKGSVQCLVYGKGMVGLLHEGDDFGKLSLVNNSPR